MGATILSLVLCLTSEPATARDGSQGAGSGAPQQVAPIRWTNALDQKPEWYGGTEAVRIADNILLWQRRSGGWPKNIDMAVVLSRSEADKVSKEPAEPGSTPDSTIDNGATREQLIYLARVFHATGHRRFKEAFLKGLDYLFAAQYANGGWPQFFPLHNGYYSHITYNDDAMVGRIDALAGSGPEIPGVFLCGRGSSPTRRAGSCKRHRMHFEDASSCEWQTHRLVRSARRTDIGACPSAHLRKDIAEW
jgi:hypothetical protein